MTNRYLEALIKENYIKYKKINDKLLASDERLRILEEKNYKLMQQSCDQELYLKSLKQKLYRLKKQRSVSS